MSGGGGGGGAPVPLDATGGGRSSGCEVFEGAGVSALPAEVSLDECTTDLLLRFCNKGASPSAAALSRLISIEGTTVADAL